MLYQSIYAKYLIDDEPKTVLTPLILREKLYADLNADTTYKMPPGRTGARFDEFERYILGKMEGTYAQVLRDKIRKEHLVSV